MWIRARKNDTDNNNNNVHIELNNPPDNNSLKKSIGKQTLRGVCFGRSKSKSKSPEVSIAVRLVRAVIALLVIGVLLRFVVTGATRWVAVKDSAIVHNPLTGRVPGEQVLQKVFEDKKEDKARSDEDDDKEDNIEEIGIGKNFARWKRDAKSKEEADANKRLMDELMKEIGAAEDKTDFARWKRPNRSPEELEAQKKVMNELMKEIGEESDDSSDNNQNDQIKKDAIIGRPAEKIEGEENVLDELMNELGEKNHKDEDIRDGSENADKKSQFTVLGNENAEDLTKETERKSQSQINALRIGSNHKIAVAVTITNDSDPKYGDLFASVSQSVFQWSQSSKYQIDMVAFVKKNSKIIIPSLEAYGFRVIEKDVPVKVKEIKDSHYKKRVDTSGCCGLSELMKLYAYTLTDYYRVLHIDADVMIVKNIDEIIDLPDTYELIHTNSTLKGELVSGGLLLFKPNLRAYEEILDIIRSGDYNYDGSGWGSSNVGYTWGGETVQGVLPYYYLKYLPAKHGIENASYRLDRCKYNHQGSKECEYMKPEDISIMHMTICQKPFRCLRMGHMPLCQFHQDTWWNLTHKALDRLGIERNIRCDRWSKTLPNKYVPIDLSKRTTLSNESKV